MWRLMYCTVFSFFCVILSSQNVEPIMDVLGVSDPTEIEDEDLERLEKMMTHPLHMNAAGRVQLEECGLFTPFQIASLLDYIARHGTVMSFSELSLIDGFTRAYVEKLRPFLSLEEVSEQYMDKVSCEMKARAGVKAGLEEKYIKWNYGIQAQVSVGGKADFSLSATRPNDAPYSRPSIYSLSAVWNHRKGKIIVGDFNARFGQGLCLWNSSFTPSLSSPSSFVRRPTGITRTHSFTGSSAITGLAADLSLGKWKASAIFSVPGIKNLHSPEKIMLLPAVNFARYGHSGHLSFTHAMTFSHFYTPDFRIPSICTSVDGSFCLRGVSVYGEAAYDWIDGSLQAIAGMECPVGEYLRLAGRLRYLPSEDEHGGSVGGEFTRKSHQGIFAVDVSAHPEALAGASDRFLQVKANASWHWTLPQDFHLKVRLTERYRTWGFPFRTDVRVDCSYEPENWFAAVRLNVLECSNIGLLSYVEAGYRQEKIALYLRYGIYSIDEWDDRIYVYERDAPGNFNVPAYYGRGMWGAAYLKWNFMKKGRLYMRCAIKKPGNAELKLLMSLLF